MKLSIDKNRSVYSMGTWGTENENNYEVLYFEFPSELEDYNKRIVYYLDDKRVWDAIIENKAYITNAITKYEKVKAYVWLTKNETITLKYVCDGTETGNYYFTWDNINYYFTMPEVSENDELIFDVATSTLKLGNITIATTTTGTGTELTFETIVDAEEDFRTKLFEMNFYENENADGIVPTQEQVDGFNTMLTAMNNKITEMNTLEENIETAEEQRELAEAERERRTNEAIDNIIDMTASYNANAEQKTNDFNANATQKTNDFNSNATSKTDDFDSHVSDKTDEFDAHADDRKEELQAISDTARDFVSAVTFTTIEENFETGNLEVNNEESLGNMGFQFNYETGDLEVEING